MEILPGNFDREFTLDELLSGISRERLSAALAVLLGPEFRLSSSGGEVLVGTAVDLAGAVRVAVRYDLEPLGWLEAVAAEDKVRAAAACSKGCQTVTKRCSSLREADCTSTWARSQPAFLSRGAGTASKSGKKAVSNSSMSPLISSAKRSPR